MTSITVSILGTSLLLQAVLAWRLFATRRELARVTTRLQRHGEALTLLTDTSETGFGAVARELERLAEVGTKPVRRSSPRRPSARKERPSPEAAAAATETRPRSGLRLHLA